MSIPGPALVAAIALILWPAIQLGAALLLRPKVQRVKAKLRIMDKNYSFSRPSKEAIKRLVRDELKRNPMFLMLPVGLPAALIAFSVQDIRGHSDLQVDVEKEVQETNDFVKKLFFVDLQERGVSASEAMEIAQDERIVSLYRYAGDIAVLRWPVTIMTTAVLTCIVLVIVLPVGLILFGIRWSLRSFIDVVKTRFFLWRAAHRTT
jgi:hypothetical protein